MRITEIREKTLMLASPMRNASIGFARMTASALVVVTDQTRDGRPVIGLAFDSVGRYGHGGLLRERFIPRLLDADPSHYAADCGNSIDPLKIFPLLMRNEKPGGHGERPGAVGLIDAAIWDLVAKLEDRPLWRHLADRFRRGVTVQPIFVYASGGHYRERDDLGSLQAELRRTLDHGFTVIKIKCGALPLYQDLRRIEAALQIVAPPNRLAIDCNGTMTRDIALSFLRAIEPLGLAWAEEPVDPLDFAAHADLASSSSVPLATGENLFSSADGKNLLRYGGLRKDRDLLQIDISLSYGVAEYLQFLRILDAYGWSVSQCYPHAGHLFSLNVIAGLGLGAHETSPNAAGGFEVVVTAKSLMDGKIGLPEQSGVGFEAHPNFKAVFGELLAA